MEWISQSVDNFHHHHHQQSYVTCVANEKPLNCFLTTTTTTPHCGSIRSLGRAQLFYPFPKSTTSRKISGRSPCHPYIVTPPAKELAQYCLTYLSLFSPIVSCIATGHTRLPSSKLPSWSGFLFPGRETKVGLIVRSERVSLYV